MVILDHLARGVAREARWCRRSACAKPPAPHRSVGAWCPARTTRHENGEDFASW